MQTVTRQFQDHVAILRLNSGPLNPIGVGLVDDLSRALTEIKGTARGMVLCGGEQFFSAGLDLPELLRLDRPAMGDFFDKLNRLCLELFTLPCPTLCALSGHAVAGGNVLALTCDYRYAASGEKKIGLNEVKLGVPVPYLADLMLRHTVGDRYATQMIFSGEFMTFADAKIIGLVDVVGPAEELETFAMERMSRLAAHPGEAFAAAKANKVAAIERSYAQHADLKNAQFLDCWFSAAAQHNLREASTKF